MYCDECGYWHYSTSWSRLYKSYICDYCFMDLEDAYYAELSWYDYGYGYVGGYLPYYGYP